MIAGVLPSAKAIGRASSRLAKTPVGHAIREGSTLRSDGLAKKLILIFMSQPHGGSPAQVRQDEKNSRHDQGPAHHGLHRQAAGFKLLSAPKAPLAKSRQPNAIVERPIQRRAALLPDRRYVTAVTASLRCLRAVDATQIHPVVTNRLADACAEGFFREHQDRSPPLAELRCTPPLRGPDR
jgi:hypothetical protein